MSEYSNKPKLFWAGSVASVITVLLNIFNVPSDDLIFVFQVLSMAGNASTSNPFIYILSQCCELKSSASHLSDINLVSYPIPIKEPEYDTRK